MIEERVMLMPRSRCLALLTRAMRHSRAGTTHLSSHAVFSDFNAHMIHRKLSSRPEESSACKQNLKKLPSFAIAGAFEGFEDTEHPDDLGHTDEHAEKLKGTNVECDRSLSEHFRRGIEKKKRWMQSLAKQKLYTTIIKSVADCYAPLYSVMGLEGKCPLLLISKSESKREHDHETEFRPLRFDDTLTKYTEQEALALLVTSKQPALALAIVEHRNKLSEELARRLKAGIGVVLPGSNVMEDRSIVTLSSHLRMFYSWGMSACAMCGPEYYPKLFDMYKRAQEAGVYVTANMNVQYLSVLIAQKRFDQVFDFYESVNHNNLPISVYFYRQLILTVSLTHKVDALDAILKEMRVKGFKLRTIDYLRAICTFDTDYFLRPKAKHKMSNRNLGECKNEEAGLMLTTPRDSYDMCRKRIQEQEYNPERMEKSVKVAQSVLALFDAMMEIDGLKPREQHLFTRVITAAVYAHECERVPELLSLHAKFVNAPLHHTSVRMAVNAFLLMENPADAWDLIKATKSHIGSHRFALMANIFKYLCEKKNCVDIIALMRDVDKSDLQNVFTLSLIKKLVPTLCSSPESVGDEKLLTFMAQFDDVFRLSTSEHHLGVFLRECCHNRRFAGVKIVLKKWVASSKKHPLRGAVGLKLLKTFEDENDWTTMAEIYELIDISRAKNEGHRKAIIESVSRAYEALGQTECARQAQQALIVAYEGQKQEQKIVDR
ncbi:hypothetical protein Plhal304r1_c011g0044771 [Plasmopara halstedii]